MDKNTAETLLDALDAGSGIIAVVGAGGKKSTLYRLLEAHRIIGTRRIALTSTVQIATTPRSLHVEHVIVDDTIEGTTETIRRRDGALLISGPSTKPGRFNGLPASAIHDLHRQGAFDVSLVKADGARMRMIKAPNQHEPALPSCAATLLPVVSARAFGRPLDHRLAHRPERLIDVLDSEIGKEITPFHVARLLTSQDGALRRSGGLSVVPIINMVDNAERLALSREAASVALAMTLNFDRVILASMISETPLVDVVRK